MLGVDDPDTLTAAHYLAVTLFAVGENEEARVLLEDTETRRRRVLGEHPSDAASSAQLDAGGAAGVG